MNWVQALISTYSAYLDAPPDENIVGSAEELNSEEKGVAKRPLLPLFHYVMTMTYEVEITSDGNFSSARVLPKWEQKCIIPGENSADARTNHPYRNPYSLHEKLSVILVDDFLDKKTGEPANQGFLNAYFMNMNKLVHSDVFKDAPLEQTEGISAIYDYLNKGTLYDDLMAALPSVFTERIEPKDWKASKKSDIGKMVDKVDGFIKFTVIGMKHSATSDLTKSKPVMEFFKQYFIDEISKNSPCGLSYVTMEQGPLLTMSGKGIFSGNARNAKLFKGIGGKIPSSGYFTYNGGFFGDISECFQMGTVEELATNSMLKWLMDHQSWIPNMKSKEPYAIVAWDMAHAKDGEFSSLDVKKIISGNRECVVEDSDDDDDDDDTVSQKTPSGEAPKLRLRAYKGYSIDGISEKTEDVAVAIFSAPSVGRASVLYYADMTADKLMDAVIHWHETAGWSVPMKNGHRKMTAASINMILRICFGRIDGKKSEKVGYPIWVVDGNKMPNIAGVLFKCLIQNYPLPYDVVSLSVDRIIHTERWGSYVSSRDYDYFLHYTAGLVRKYYIDKEGKDYMPYLDETCMDRDYLYGRLLATYDNIERWALDENHSDRPTNAIRMTAEFYRKPATTAAKLNQRVNPYIQRLGKKVKYKENLLNELLAKISSIDGGKTDREMNASIGPRGVMGYAAQMDSFREMAFSTNKPDSK